MSLQTFTWTATGDGSVNTSGLFTAGSVAGVATVKASSASITSNSAGITVQVVAQTAAPTNLTATGVGRKINLSWQQSASPGVTANKIYRSSTGASGPFTNIVTVTGGTTSYSDGNITRFQTYWYYVTAVAGGVESQPSSVVSAASK